LEILLKSPLGVFSNPLMSQKKKTIHLTGNQSFREMGEELNEWWTANQTTRRKRVCNSYYYLHMYFLSVRLR